MPPPDITRANRMFAMRMILVSMVLGIILAAVLVHFWPAIRQEMQTHSWREVQAAVDESGHWGPVICVLLYALFTLFFIPTTPLSVLVGVSFGVMKGILIALLGVLMGISAAFLAARYLMRPFMERRIGGLKIFKAIDAGVHKDGWRIVFFARLFPVNPYNLLNYAFGLTRIPYWQYALASCAGIIPGLLALLWTAAATGRLATGKVDWRVFAALFAGAMLFAVISWLPKLLRTKPHLIEEE